MNELPNEYLNLLSQQMILTSSFLGGFAATILGTLIASGKNDRCSKAMIVCTAFSALCFVVCLLAMTSLFLYTSEGFPVAINQVNFVMARIVGVITLVLGLVSFIASIGCSGWLVSKGLGITTSVFATIALVIILAMTISVG